MEANKLSKSDPPPFQMSLGIRHPSMDPAAISRAMLIDAEHSFRAGEPRRSRSGVASTAVHAESYWLAALNPASWLEDMSFSLAPSLASAQKQMSAPVTRTLGWALSLCAARLGQAHGALLHQIRSEGGQVNLLVTLSPLTLNSFSLTPEASRIFGELGITLEFELATD
jgi:hypothetical protein